MEAKEPEADQSWDILPRVRAGISEKSSASILVLVLKFSSNCLKIAWSIEVLLNDTE